MGLRLCAAIALLLMSLTTPSLAQKKLALVVGNDSYKQVPVLQRARADAELMASTLQSIGFDVALHRDLGQRELSRELAAFENRVQPGDTVFVFFAGHGIGVGESNFLLPVDVAPEDAANEGALRRTAIAETQLISDLRERGPKALIVVVDACRDNPFQATGRRSIGGTRGLVRTPLPTDVFMIRSASPGQAALDRLPSGDTDRNSVFTRVFAPRLREPGASMLDIAKSTQQAVNDMATSVGLQQMPDYVDRVLGHIVLLPGTAPASSALGSQASAGAAPAAQRPPAAPATQVATAAAAAATQNALRRISLIPAGPVPLANGDSGGLVFRECEDCPVMVRIPGQSYALARTETTFDEWDACVAAKACPAVDDLGRGRGRQPVMLVSFDDASAYARWLSSVTGKTYRLPSESEWMFAAAGQCVSDCELFGEHKAMSSEVANYRWIAVSAGGARLDPPRQPFEVGTFPANSFGLFDMFGNVREWVADCWSREPPPMKPVGAPRQEPDCKARVVRGGSFADGVRDLQLTARAWEQPQERSARIGFRLARRLDSGGVQ